MIREVRMSDATGVKLVGTETSPATLKLPPRSAPSKLIERIALALRFPVSSIQDVIILSAVCTVESCNVVVTLKLGCGALVNGRNSNLPASGCAMADPMNVLAVLCALKSWFGKANGEERALMALTVIHPNTTAE